jgi:hypothetical protein
MGFDPNWRLSASARRKGLRRGFANHSRWLAFLCQNGANELGIGEDKVRRTCGPKLISLNNSRQLKKGMEDSRDRLFC